MNRDQGREDAAAVAALLNQVCHAAVTALAPTTEPGRRSQLAAALDELQADMTETPQVQHFLRTVAGWLRGRRPGSLEIEQLEGPFQRALQSMIEQIADDLETLSADVPTGSEAELLARTSAAVLAALQEGAPETHAALAVQILNLGQEMSDEARPLIENLRALLGGASPDQLPDLAGTPYSSIWHNVRLLLAGDPDLGESARDALLDRLVHNAFFALRANSPDLTAALVQSWTGLQRQAVAAGQPDLATFILALRLRLQGQNPADLISTLPPEYVRAWQPLAMN